MEDKKDKIQEVKYGYCDNCKKQTTWMEQIPNRGGTPKKFICLSIGCYHTSDNPEENKRPVINNDYY